VPAEAVAVVVVKAKPELAMGMFTTCPVPAGGVLVAVVPPPPDEPPPQPPASSASGTATNTHARRSLLMVVPSRGYPCRDSRTVCAGLRHS
jgi:hypothetical protein